MDNRLKFKKEQEVKWSLSNLRVIKVPILSDLPIIKTLFWNYKMNTAANKPLFAGDKFMPEMHLKQWRLTHSACGPFTKNKERMKKLKKQHIQEIFIKMN